VGAGAPDFGDQVIRLLTERGLTIAVAESLTGGMLVAELIRTPGASAVVRGGIVAYDTRLKHALLGVDAALLAEHGAVHPEVAAQMASGVRERLAVDGRRADIGVATTGVAGPDSHDGHAPGSVMLGFAIGDEVETETLRLSGSRADIRMDTVTAALEGLLARLNGAGE
jgi:nicotinamide-nucleotide amidase